MLRFMYHALYNSIQVILMGHAPPGRYDTIDFYAQYYSRLVLEFHDVIGLQVFGHTHDNEFKLVSSLLSSS